jgi:hypothetical protein
MRFLRPRNGRALTGRKPRKIRANVRVVVLSAARPRPLPVRVPVLVESAMWASPRPSPARSQSVIVSSPRLQPRPQPQPRIVLVRELSALAISPQSRNVSASPRPYSVHDPSGNMTRGSRFDYKPRWSAKHFVNRRAKMVQAVSTARFCPSPFPVSTPAC